MLPLFILWLIRRYHHSGKGLAVSKKSFETLRTQLPRYISIALIVALVLLTFNGHSQAKSLNYQIMRKGSKVGSLHFSQFVSAGMNYLEMESEVKTSFVFTFTAKVKEEAVYYSNGVLLRSSIYRKMNGSEKVNKQHHEANNQYIIHSGKDSVVTKNYPITYNMLSLYNEEPVNVSKVYSDIFETFLAIQKTGDHDYKIDLPDGNYNCYYYKDGVLNLVEVHNSLYSATIVLAK
jgi:hypothetical protein